ncbi:alpha/beta fold hydrolase [Xenorhabdus sp. TH1]|uniref:alpha/beta fold hydrolase n=1 Tax=Xenorhabdus sp. TH1 TaxID=3130166 RepID=UPI0030D39D07
MGAAMQERPHGLDKPTVRTVLTEDGVQLSVQAISPDGGGRGIALLCLHGLFSDGRFFYNGSKKGPAAYFLKEGCQVFIGELRGHGHNREQVGSLPRDWCFDDYVQQDIGCLIEHVYSVHQGPFYVVAHSFGGYALLASLGHRPELQRCIRGICLFSSAVNDYSEHGLRKRIFFNLAAALSAVCGYFPARRFGLGVSDAPNGLIQQFRHWALRGSFDSRRGDIDYWQSLQFVTVPVWAGVGSGDTFHASVARGRKLLQKLGSADKTFVELGLTNGFSKNFGHIDVLRGEAAATEILPQVLAWINAHEAAACTEGAAPAVSMDSGPENQ